MVRLTTVTFPVLLTALLALLLAVLMAVSGCTSRVSWQAFNNRQLEADRALVTDYFVTVNAAADEGSAAQERVFTVTQHPDFRDMQCSLQGLTVTADPAYTTLHGDPEWHPPDIADPPRGTIYVVAATITVEQDATVLATQIGSLHVVVLDGAAYGFSPCPA